MNDYLSREPGNNESRPNVAAIDSDDLLDELWPGLVDEVRQYPCFGCGEMVNIDDCHATPDEMHSLCEDCWLYGRERNEASIREPWEN